MQKEINHRRHQEAVSFIGRMGINYATNSATKEEKIYFLGILYNKDGVAKKEYISKIATNAEQSA